MQQEYLNLIEQLLLWSCQGFFLSEEPGKAAEKPGHDFLMGRGYITLRFFIF
jgi:hypothetical protein